MTTKAYRGRALITGASTGIGAVYADRLARRGYDVILVARNKDFLDGVAKRITQETQRSAEVMVADLTDKQELAQVEAKLRTDSSITVLVNNAGLASAAPLLQADVEDMDAMIALNVTALMRLTYAAVPGFVARGEGAIINIASIVAIAPELLNGVYGATKAFVLGFSQSLQHELSAKGVRIQAVLPGATRTPLWARAGVDVDKALAGFVMTAEDMVDASLVGFDQGEFATVPALPDIADWTAFETARVHMQPSLSRRDPAARYTPRRSSAA